MKENLLPSTTSPIPHYHSPILSLSLSLSPSLSLSLSLFPPLSFSLSLSLPRSLFPSLCLLLCSESDPKLGRIPWTTLIPSHSPAPVRQQHTHSHTHTPSPSKWGQCLWQVH